MSSLPSNSAGPNDDHWEAYITEVDEKPALILVDVGIASAAPIAGLNQLVWVWIKLKSTDEMGFPLSDEDDRLNEIEDELLSALDATDIRFVGRITTDGRREFYFYASESETFAEIVSQTLRSSPDDDFEIDTVEDPNWSHYRDVLFPAPEDFQEINNQIRIDRLRDDGDSLVTPRPVDHFANFSSEKDRDSFIGAAAALGYEVTSRPTRNSDTDLPYAVGMLRTHAVDEDTIDRLTFELFELAREHNGEYEGWGSPIIK